MISKMKSSKYEESDSDSSETTDTEGESENEEKPSSSVPSKALKRNNPFFNTDEGDSDVSDLSDSDDSKDDDSGSDSDEDSDHGDDGSDKKVDNGEEEEDPLIAALKKSKEKKERDSPPDIKFRGSDLTDFTFHPTENLIVSSHVDGDMSLFEYSNELNKLQKKLKLHKGAVRSVEFDRSGKFLVSGSKDKSFKITDIETSQIVYKAVKAHCSALYKVKPLTFNLIATGDEDGTVKLWDNRIKTGQDSNATWGSVMETKQFDEFVSDIFFDESIDDKTMVASSGEGTILGFNLAGKKPDIQSEVYDGEMNAMGIVHRNSKLVTACGDGRLYMFDWKQWGYHSADFPGHPDAINYLVSATDNVVITACDDGTIRAVHLYPHRFIGTVGSHEGNFPVERLDISGSGELLASISHDQKIKFWNIKYLEEMEYNRRPKPFHQKKIKMRRKENKMQKAREHEYQLPSSNRGNRKDFFKELDEDNN